MSDPTYKLTQSVRTVTESKRLLLKLDRLLASSHTTTSDYKNLSKKLTAVQRQLLIEDLQDLDTTLSEPEAQKIISDIRNSIKKMPIATLELAFQSSDLFTEEITDTMKAIIKTPCLVQIKHNPTIGGGIVIYFQGRHHDYSLTDKFDEFSKV
jgi:F0F1-type ATP synthase delta subunit